MSCVLASLSTSRVLAGRLRALFLFLAGPWVALAGTSAPSQRLWQPVPDEVYLQEVGRQIKSAGPIHAVAVRQEEIFTGGQDGVSRLERDQLIPVAEVRSPIQRLFTTQDSLWAAGTEGYYRLQDGQWRKVGSAALAALTEHNGQIYAAIGAKLYRLEGDALRPASPEDAPFPITHLATHGESLYVVGPGRVTVFDGARFGGRDVYDSYSDQAVDWGEFPSRNLRDVLSDGARLWFATDRGLTILRGMSLSTVRGGQGLPYEDNLCLAKGFTNDMWIGSTRGAIRLIGGQFHYFAGQRWLPSDKVNAIAGHDQTVYLATDAGLGIIHYEPFTLLKKAAYYERHLQEWGQKRLGFTHKLEWDDGLKEFVREVSDNDGGYSGNYLVAQSYRYAVTRDPEARREAIETFEALRWLEAMTGIPGLPARSVWAKGERGHKAMHGSGGYPAEWHDTADGLFEWKGDTSSDELCSHFYAVMCFLELVATGSEVDQAKQHLRRMATHLVDHEWQLIDQDGKPTRWGRWDPEYFRTDEGRFDRGLQALEILSFIKTAAEICGDAKFSQAYQKLVELGYPSFTLRQRQVFPPENIAHFEDELALWSYWNLVRLEKEPQLRSLYRRSLDRTWEIVRVEQNPWFNFVYGALTGNDCEAAAAVTHLRDWPLDLRTWSYQNSHRTDLRTPTGYSTLKGGIRALPPRETEPLRWDHWTMQLDGGSGGRDVVEPGGWLEAYWIGRYYQFIAPPGLTDQGTFTVEAGRKAGPGAKPYDGPARPRNLP
ncbi:MAG: hypothetical protein U1G07_23540 [Verrucomicrobiota bacterium]